MANREAKDARSNLRILAGTANLELSPLEVRQSCEDDFAEIPDHVDSS
jgi:hypothetical protein